MPHSSYAPRRHRGHFGFTLVEMLLVIVIIAIATAVSMPSFVKSMRGNRRRTAARTVIAAGRYARSMAVLHQRAMAITFDLDAGSLSVAAVRHKVKADDADADEDGAREEGPSPLDTFASGRDERPAPAAAGVADTLERVLDQITISYVDIAEGERCMEGSCVVVYQTNGRCAPYEVRLVDDTDVGLVIKVDALASALTVAE